MKRWRVPFSLLVAVVIMGIPGSLFAQGGPPDPRPGATAPVREQNLDANSWIAVHEQGVADVNIAGQSGSLEVTGTVEVTNTVDVQGEVNVANEVDVNVTGGEVGIAIAPATKAVSAVVGTAAGTDTSWDLDSEDTIYATTIFISNGELSEFVLSFDSPLEGDLFKILDLNGEMLVHSMSFTHPVPIDGLHMDCFNESENCNVSVSVVGY